MPTNRKLLGAAAFSLALAGGGVAGALLGTPNLSTAQDGTEDSTDETTAEAGRPGPGGHRGVGLATAAEALGISQEDLRTALEGGQSIAQVAEAEGVEVQTIIEALVADATTRLEEAITNLPDRMTELVNREGLPDRDGPRGPGGHHGGRGLGLEAAADAIGITDEELRTELRGGPSIADVAATHDVDVQTVIDALVAEAATHIDDAVADGRLTEAEATERTADLAERTTAHVNGERPAGGPLGAPADQT